MTSGLGSQQPSQPLGSLLGRFYRFLRRPFYTVNVPSQTQPLRDILRLYALALVLVLPLAIMVGLLAEKLSSSHAISEMADQPLLIFTMAVIIAPPLEEVLFRLPLRYTPINLTLPLFLWLLIILGTLASAKIVSALWILPLLCLAFLGCVFLRVWLKEKMPAQPIHKHYEKWIGWFFYGSTIIFGLIHISNYQLINDSALLLAPLLVSPQVLLGVFFAFVRLRYGFWWGVFTHAFHNGLLVGQMLLYRMFSSTSMSTEVDKITVNQKLITVIFSLSQIAFLLLCLFIVVRMVHEWRAEGQVSQASS
ncbi:CPBP family intramembrane glutamic endopeptidase [Acaryochloris sp. CCMEE 5410]|uniref:CPBP family intramembrane glutamic endopeptidase n=1 Tax=Acaryochloris sp. CCMEE 5410 TaxID=310037 RepID=UPI0002484879|nr:CPBP family intramembrane glutamic endopeptidase [Acaryochloris sp. CCMEE 5410]KAI9130870.1 CPBP family intramembrane metalloprotease [Acaryochloris sp. CCMEE 5410]